MINYSRAPIGQIKVFISPNYAGGFWGEGSPSLWPRFKDPPMFWGPQTKLRVFWKPLDNILYLGDFKKGKGLLYTTLNACILVGMKLDVKGFNKTSRICQLQGKGDSLVRGVSQAYSQLV